MSTLLVGTSESKRLVVQSCRQYLVPVTDISCASAARGPFQWEGRGEYAIPSSSGASFLHTSTLMRRQLMSF